jgi:hypothetical protein
VPDLVFRTALIVTIAALAGCANSTPKPPTAARQHSTNPDAATCAELASRPAAHELARKLVDRVVAPEHQSERTTIGIIGESLYATCRQPRLPGVKSVKEYRPVKTVLAAVQRDFDEDEISGG